MKSKPDVALRDSEGNTAIDVATKSGYSSILASIRNNSYDRIRVQNLEISSSWQHGRLA